MAELMKITEVAERLGVSTGTVTAWEDEGSGFPTSRVHNGIRVYKTEDIEKYLEFGQTKKVTGDPKVLDGLSKELIKRALKSGADRQILFKALQPEMFRDELYALFTIMHSRRGRDGGSIDRQYLEILLSRRPEFVLNNENIDLSIFSDSETDVELAFINSVLKYYDKYMLEDVTSEELNLVIDKFLAEYEYMRVAAMLDNAAEMFKNGLKQGRKQLKGSTDTMAYLTESFNTLRAELAPEQGQGLLLTSEVGMIDAEASKSIQIGDFGGLESLTKLYNGVRTGMFYNFLAPPKSGKSKFCFRLAYISMTKYKQAVVFWPKEGGPQKLMAELRAIHFSEYYEDNGTVGNSMNLSAQDILFDRWPSPEIQQLEAVSRADLFASGKYGQVAIIDAPLTLETFEEEITNAVKTSGATSVYIDYLALIESSNARIGKSERIGTAYQRALILCKALNVALISPAQYKQEFIKELVKGEAVDARIAGGESSEIIRTPDVNLAFYAEPEKLLEFEMDLLSVPSRNAEAFPRKTIYADLGKAFFADINA